MDKIEIFNKYAEMYDEWYDENKFIYLSEINALRRFIPKGRGLEIGVGTGRFSIPFNIKYGVDPSKRMSEIAKKRGINVHIGYGENLPYKNNSFDFILITTTLCFVDDPIKVLKESKRVLKPGGRIIIGIIDKDSFLGKIYQSKKEGNPFYKHAKFLSAREVIDYLKDLKFRNIEVVQTIFKKLEEINEIEEVKDGYGEGGFVVISATKYSRSAKYNKSLP